MTPEMTTEVRAWDEAKWVDYTDILHGLYLDAGQEAHICSDPLIQDEDALADRLLALGDAHANESFDAQHFAAWVQHMSASAEMALITDSICHRGGQSRDAVSVLRFVADQYEAVADRSA